MYPLSGLSTNLHNTNDNCLTFSTKAKQCFAHKDPKLNTYMFNRSTWYRLPCVFKSIGKKKKNHDIIFKIPKLKHNIIKDAKLLCNTTMPWWTTSPDIINFIRIWLNQWSHNQPIMKISKTLMLMCKAKRITFDQRGGWLEEHEKKSLESLIGFYFFICLWSGSYNSFLIYLYAMLP